MVALDGAIGAAQDCHLSRLLENKLTGACGRLVILSLFVASFLSSMPQAVGEERRILFTNLEVSDGIGGGEIRSIIQDRQGFMWFATQTGLNRYDGHKIRTFRHLGKDAKSLSADDITALCEDSQGWLWVGTKSQGLNRYDPAHEAFIRIPGMGANFGELEITSILETSERTLWFGTRAGLFVMDKVSWTPKRVGMTSADGGEPDMNVMVETLYEDDRGTLWVGTRSKGLCFFDRHSLHTFLNMRAK